MSQHPDSFAPQGALPVALQARDVSKRYEGASQEALSGINLAVRTGEFYSFLGPSGCGKTTMLRIFAGFESATTGSVIIGGVEMNGVPPNKRPVNMVFQSYALFPHLSVLENVAFGLRAKSGKEAVNSAEIVSRASEALSIVRLGTFGDRLPTQLSGGQQQRVALARALVMRPLVLLLDEPLSALDVQIREEMQDELSRLQRQLNITFVMVTHDQSEALALSSSVAVFNGGRIEQIGQPAEIYDSPHTAFVARFIGRSNVLIGKVLESSAEADSILVEVASGRLRCDLDGAASRPQVGATVELCVKPEAVLPLVPGDQNNREDNVLPAHLETSAYQGSLADLRLNLASIGSGGGSGSTDTTNDTVIRATVPASSVAAMAAAGYDLRVHLAPSALRLLKSSEEERPVVADEGHAYAQTLTP